MNKYREGKYLGERILLYEYEQVQPNGLPTIIKRKVIRPLKQNEKVVNGEVITIEDPLINE